MNKQNLFAILQVFLISIYSQIMLAQTNVGGTLTSDTEWDIEGSPYHITNTVGVSAGVKLKIRPGVQIIFDGNYQIVVLGSLSALGKSDSIISFDGNSSGNAMIVFKNTDLSNSEISHIYMQGGQKGIQLSSNNSDNNTDTLKISNISLENTSIISKGYDSNSKIIIDSAKVKNSIIQGDYPRSEPIELKNSYIENSKIFSYAYNHGIFLKDCQINSTELASGCCDANVNIESSHVTNCSFYQANDSQPGYHNYLNINESRLLDSDINMPISTVNISNSIVEYSNDYQKTYCIISGNGTVENTAFLGNGNNVGIERGPSSYSYDNKMAYTINGSSFSDFKTSIKINGGTQATSGNGPVSISNCSFYASTNFNLRNNSPYDISALENYWGTTDENQIKAMIFDAYDDINSGFVDFSDFLSSPPQEVPISKPINLFKGTTENGIMLSWDSNQESNLAGYKIYYKTNNVTEFTLLADVGNVNSYVTDQIEISDLVVVTAYNDQASGIKDFLEGNESGYSDYAENYFSDVIISSSSLCSGDTLNVDLSSNFDFSDNYFILQLSDDNGSFENVVNLDSTSLVSETLSALLPDTIRFGVQYLVRVFSSSLNAHSASFQIIEYDNPASDFLITHENCQSDTVTIQFDAQFTNGLTLNWVLDGGHILENQQDSLLKVVWPSFGEKEITLEAISNGCTSISSQTIKNNKTPTNDFTVQSLACEGESIIVNYTGNGADTAVYTWDFDGGEVIYGDGLRPYEIIWNSFGIKNISLSVSEGNCTSGINTKSIEYNQYPPLIFEADESICHNSNYAINYTGENFGEVSWDFDGATIVSGSGPGPYLLKWNSSGEKSIHFSAGNNGCNIDTIINVSVAQKPLVPEICMVTVDEESSKNMLVWSYDLETVDQFGIYRETNVAGEYALVEYVEGASFNTYIDNQSSPEQKSNRYKITTVDSCGAETELSNYHKTIHLTINKGLNNSWNLIWDGYEGFAFGSYRIYRSLNGGDFELLAEIASNLSSYTDVDVLSSDVAYQIEVLNPNNCETSSNGRTFRLTSSKSNVARNNTVTGVNTLDLSTNIIYPNPTTNKIVVQFNSHVNGQFSVYNEMGVKIITGFVKKMFEIDLSNQPQGIYLLRLETERGSVVKQIIKR